ncbi:hypothetical protein SVAN01_00492 [Stagonosporopsis vannaccii]|nr:hypothetical protein SVAN01_00492 [Stagonosporopsis vannaccii]
MAPMPESARPRARRQPFVATCSPDELLGQIVQALLPKYNIDSPHLLALRQVVASAIVAPRKPPTLKRTRPDRRIGEIGSIYDTPRRSIHGPNGPPASVDQSFFFHHQDPDFMRLLPQVDRSRYEWPGEPASESSSDGEEVPNSQHSLTSMLSEASAVSLIPRSASLQPTAAPAFTPANRRRRFNVANDQQTSKARTIEGLASDSDSLAVDDLQQEDAPTDLRGHSHCSIPAIVITTPNSSSKHAMIIREHNPVPFPSFRNTDGPAKLPVTQDDRTGTEPSFPSASPILILADTQDTVNSTQQSEVFSPPDTFVNFTPPSQEDTQSTLLSQVATAGSMEPATANKPKIGVPRCSSRRSSLSFEPALGKRSRTGSRAIRDQTGPKRRKSTE